MELDPKKRPAAHHIIDWLDKTASTVEPGNHCSSVEQHVDFLQEQYCQENNLKLSSECLEDIKEHAETEELTEYVGTGSGHGQQGQEKSLGDEWSSWGAQDTKQTVNPEGASISVSKSGKKLFSLKNLIFNKKAHRKNLGNGRPMLGFSRTLGLFKKGELKPFLKSSNLIGKDGFAKVYKGLIDNAPVTLRKLIAVPDEDQFEDEIIIQSGVIHNNIVRLIGVCFEFDVPILIYEFLFKDSLYDILHGDNKVPLNLGARLSIAATSADALAYMHSMYRTKLLHGDFKPANILFDDNFMPKVDMGISRMIARFGFFDIDDYSLSYMDPVFQQTGLLTEKSDAYSFGVVILELLTRKKAKHAGNNSLVRNFLENHKQGRKSTELFDKEIALAEDLELLDNLAEMAMECLNLDVDQRPTMMNVAKRLTILNKSHELTLLQASCV
jgi:hypothetical protein